MAFNIYIYKISHDTTNAILNSNFVQFQYTCTYILCIDMFKELHLLIYQSATELLQLNYNCLLSTFATNYRHLCYNYELVQTDWHSGLAHLLGKVKMKYQNKKAQNCPADMSIIRELCDIRDGRHIACDNISKAEVCSLLDIICTE